jgi:hypothetical protein
MEARSLAKRKNPTSYEKKRLIKLYLRRENINCPIDQIREESQYFKDAFEQAKNSFL